MFVLLILLILIIFLFTPVCICKRESFKNTKQKIPKIIHQCYESKNIPKILKTSIKKLKKMNPDYEYRFYTDKDINKYMKKNYPEIYDDFMRINPKYGPARADLFRYCVIYKDGGCYFDLKSGVSKPLNKIIKPDDEYLLSSWPEKYRINTAGMPDTNFGELQQWHVIGRPKHPYLKLMIKDVINNIRNYHNDNKEKYPNGNVGKEGVVYLSGPVQYTQTIYPIINKYPHSFIKDNYNGNLIYDLFKNVKFTNQQKLKYKNKKDKRTGLHLHILEVDKIHYSELDEPIIF